MNGCRRRQLLGELVLFLETLCLQVQAGYELSHAWERAAAGRPTLLGPNPWQRLAREWPLVEHRVWFSLVAELQETGAPLAPLLRAFATAVREERRREWESFRRALPGRLSVALLFCFLPAAFLLLFVPLLASFP